MSIIATSSDQLKFHLWPEGKLLQSYKSAHSNEGAIKTISWGRDGSWVVLVPSTGATEVISIKDNIKLLQTIQDIYQPTCAAFQNSTKKNIAIGTLGGQVFMYDIKAKTIRKRFPKSNYPIINVQYNFKDTHIAASSANGKILLFNNISPNISSSYVIPESETVSALNFHRTKRTMLGAGSEEGIIATWDINKNKALCHIKAHQAPVTDIIVSPIRSDLLISSGLDRKFAFYDLLTKNCITEIEVTNSITALDFSCCGTFLGLGSRNGNVILYDARRLNKPISAFTAHNGKPICQLLFQKTLTTKNELMDNSFDVLVNNSPKPQEHENKNEMTDSLVFAACDYSDVPVQETEKESIQGAKDSFLVALGLDNSVDRLSVNETESLFVPEITKESQKSIHALKLTQVSSEPSQVSNIKQFSSTPKHLLENVSISTISPIINNQNVLYNNDNLKQLLREIVKEELQNQTEKFTEELAKMFSHIRRSILDLHLSIFKECGNLEDKIDKITNNNNNTKIVCDDFLVNQNKRLLKEVEILKQRLVDQEQTKNRKF